MSGRGALSSSRVFRDAVGLKLLKKKRLVLDKGPSVLVLVLGSAVVLLASLGAVGAVWTISDRRTAKVLRVTARKYREAVAEEALAEVAKVLRPLWRTSFKRARRLALGAPAALVPPVRVADFGDPEVQLALVDDLHPYAAREQYALATDADGAVLDHSYYVGAVSVVATDGLDAAVTREQFRADPASCKTFVSASISLAAPTAAEPTRLGNAYAANLARTWPGSTARARPSSPPSSTSPRGARLCIQILSRTTFPRTRSWSRGSPFRQRVFFWARLPVCKALWPVRKRVNIARDCFSSLLVACGFLR